MLVRDIVKTLDAEILTGEENLELDIQAGCGADLMSDVMALSKTMSYCYWPHKRAGCKNG